MTGKLSDNLVNHAPSTRGAVAGNLNETVGNGKEMAGNMPDAEKASNNAHGRGRFEAGDNDSIVFGNDKDDSVRYYIKGRLYKTDPK